MGLLQPNTQTRKLVFDERDRTAQAGDLQGAFDVLPRYITKQLEAFYAEPLALGSPLENQQPESVELVRVQSINSPDSPVASGGMVHWQWKPTAGGVIVLSIDGMSPSTTIKYRFFFRFAYTAAAGMV